MHQSPKTRGKLIDSKLPIGVNQCVCDGLVPYMVSIPVSIPGNSRIARNQADTEDEWTNHGGERDWIVYCHGLRKAYRYIKSVSASSGTFTCSGVDYLKHVFSWTNLQNEQMSILSCWMGSYCCLNESLNRKLNTRGCVVIGKIISVTIIWHEILTVTRYDIWRQ